MHWPTHVQRSPHSYISPVPNWLLVLVIRITVKCFCFGFDLTDLFDFYLGLKSIIGFSGFWLFGFY